MAAMLDHVNVVTHDLDGTAAFYASVLELDRRDGPSPLRPDKVQWLHDASGRAVIHLVLPEVVADIVRPALPGDRTGAIHHVAFDCTGYPAMIARLEALGLGWETNDLPSIGLRQLFVGAPDGVLLELNFRAA
ncbi:MAG: VOC family protein [Pseudomonadota bacterium]